MHLADFTEQAKAQQSLAAKINDENLSASLRKSHIKKRGRFSFSCFGNKDDVANPQKVQSIENQALVSNFDNSCLDEGSMKKQLIDLAKKMGRLRKGEEAEIPRSQNPAMKNLINALSKMQFEAGNEVKNSILEHVRYELASYLSEKTLNEIRVISQKLPKVLKEED